MTDEMAFWTILASSGDFRGYVFGAYTAVFVLLFAFLGVLFLRVRNLGREVDDLKDRVNPDRQGEEEEAPGSR
jgi:CcmD family protein